MRFFFAALPAGRRDSRFGPSRCRHSRFPLPECDVLNPDDVDGALSLPTQGRTAPYLSASPMLKSLAFSGAKCRRVGPIRLRRARNMLDVVAIGSYAARISNHRYKATAGVPMFDALHPTKNEMISVREYLEYAILAGYQFTKNAPAARCPVCKGAMRNRSGGTKADEHFYHLEDDFCPTKNPSARPYLNKPPRFPNENAIAANRKFVVEHLELIYAKMHDLVPRLDFTEFISLLEEAKRLNIYGYAGLVPEHVPYVLVTLMNFLPNTSYQKSRLFKFIFFYDTGIKSYDDLWIDRGFASDLIRVSYDKSATKKVKKIDVGSGYLLEAQRTLSPKMMKWCLNVM